MASRKVPRYQKEEEEARRLAEEERAVASGKRIEADLGKQAPSNTYGPPLTYYEDYKFACRDCGSRETWTAKQQQWWYEVAKGPVYSHAVRCRKCRQARKAPSASAENKDLEPK